MILVILCALGAIVDFIQIRLLVHMNFNVSNARRDRNDFLLVVNEFIDRFSALSAPIRVGLCRELPKNLALVRFFSSGVFGLAIQILRLSFASDLCAMLQTTLSDGYRALHSL